MAPVVGICPRLLCCSSWSWTQCCRAWCLQFKAVAKHQAVERDLAIVVAEQVTHSEVMAAVERLCLRHCCVPL